MTFCGDQCRYLFIIDSLVTDRNDGIILILPVLAFSCFIIWSGSGVSIKWRECHRLGVCFAAVTKRAMELQFCRR